MRKEPKFVHVNNIWVLKPGKYILKKPLIEYIDEEDPVMVIVGCKFKTKFTGKVAVTLPKDSIFCFNKLKLITVLTVEYIESLGWKHISVNRDGGSHSFSWGDKFSLIALHPSSPAKIQIKQDVGKGYGDWRWEQVFVGKITCLNDLEQLMKFLNIK